MRFVVLDSFRGLCAVAIVLTHFPAVSHIYDTRFVQSAYLFVDFFFCLSGYIITHRYIQEIRDGMSFSSFVALRLGRLYPLHVLTLLAFVGFNFATYAYVRWILNGDASEFFVGEKAPITILFDALLIHGIGITENTTWNAPSWSISAEFFIYMLFFVCVAIFARQSAKRSFLAVATAIAAISALIVFVFSPDGMANSHSYAFWRCAYGFFIGALVHQLAGLSASSPLFGSRSKAISTAVELLVLLAVALFVTHAGYTQMDIISPLLFAAAIVVYQCEAGYVSWLLRRRAFVFIGALSYSIYMVHSFVKKHVIFHLAAEVEQHTGWKVIDSVMVDGARRFTWFGDVWLGDVATVATLAVTIVVAWAATVLVERPVRGWVARRVRPRRSEPAAALAAAR